jgi:hypothetical protein
MDYSTIEGSDNKNVCQYLYQFDEDQEEWEKSIVGENLSLAAPDSKDDIKIEVVQYEDKIEQITMLITLETGDILKEKFQGNYVPALYEVDLTKDGKMEIILLLSSATSNYNATDVHIWSIENNELKEILTIIDSPAEEDIETYSNSFLDYRKSGSNIDSEITQFCSGAYPIEVDDFGNGLKICHAALAYEPVVYSIVVYDGQWKVLTN